MAEVKNCLLPDDLYYSVENSLWVRDLENGTAEVGMTDIAQTLAGAMLHCTAKKVGKTVKKGKSIATPHSEKETKLKWMGDGSRALEAVVSRKLALWLGISSSISITKP